MTTQLTHVPGKGEEFRFSADIQADSLGRNDDGSIPSLSDADLHQRLVAVDDEIGTGDLEGLKFLCRDHLSASKLDKASSALEIFENMKKALLIDVNNVDFLLECLGRIHRFDLVRKLGFQVDAVREFLPSLNKIFPFRVLLMEIADDIEDQDVEKIRFLLRGRVKKKLLTSSPSLLEMFVLLEQEGLLSANRLDLLTWVLQNIGRPELLENVRRFAGGAPRSSEPSVLAQVPSDRADIPQAHEFQNRINPPEMTMHRVTPLQRDNPHGNLERSPSAGTVTLSSTEEGEESPNDRDIPKELLQQIARDVSGQFDNLAIELGMSNRDILEYKDRYKDLRNSAQHLLTDWQNKQQDRGSVVPKLRYVLQKLGYKQAATALDRWLNTLNYSRQLQNEENHCASVRESKPVPEVNLSTLTLQERAQVTGALHQQQATSQTQTTGTLHVQQTQTTGTLQAQVLPPDHTGWMPMQTTNPVPPQLYQGQPGLGQGGVIQQMPPGPVHVTSTLEFESYSLNSYPRGWCVIINNQEFHVEPGSRESTQMPRRGGTDKDAESLQLIFEELGFIVRRYDNMTDTQMSQKLIDAAHNVDHEKFDAFVCCILTHGVLNHLYGSNGKLISIKDLTSTFQSNRCPSLAGKPKLFFLQACQGRDKMGGGEYEKDSGEGDIQVDTLPKELIPNEADFLLGYATVPGYVSFRSRNHGSWYIRKLVQLLSQHSDRHDLLSILTEVNRQVSAANANIDGGLFKQVPAPLFTLRKKLFLRRPAT
ncbi:caspase-8-like [Mya arenaria]|uniref:caspase-8-like n=1 Tax=Mya arenaria TaxID=6604 RepID=UPI0022E663DE|nr:caspase-8-like [Mya arenaria]XP_052812846.1 caspase-8-like [Mya arenaria]XP_052812847.1 caspase-8-like [Mya arenaria]